MEWNTIVICQNNRFPSSLANAIGHLINLGNDNFIFVIFLDIYILIYCPFWTSIGCERYHAYCSSSNREKVNIVCVQLVASNILFHAISLRKANWYSVVSPVDTDQRYIAISNEWRYLEQKRRLIFQTRLPDWLLPIWTLPSVCEIRDKCRLFTRN